MNSNALSQNQVLELEDKLDNLHADFSEVSNEEVKLKDAVLNLEQEVARVTGTLDKASGDQRKKHAVTLNAKARKLHEAKEQLAALQMKRSGITESVEKCELELAEKRSLTAVKKSVSFTRDEAAKPKK